MPVMLEKSMSGLAAGSARIDHVAKGLTAMSLQAGRRRGSGCRRHRTQAGCPLRRHSTRLAAAIALAVAVQNAACSRVWTCRAVFQGPPLAQPPAPPAHSLDCGLTLISPHMLRVSTGQMLRAGGHRRLQLLPPVRLPFPSSSAAAAARSSLPTAVAWRGQAGSAAVCARCCLTCQTSRGWSH